MIYIIVAFLIKIIKFMFNFKKSVSMLFIIFGICGLFFATKTQAETGNPDLTVTGITFSGSQQGETGKLAVTIKNLGGDLNNTAGLLNTYNNFSSQNFVFDSSTPSATQFKTDRALPDPSTNNPLKTNETITFYWYGSFNTSGNLYLQYTVDNANELVETNENNNTLSVSIPIGAIISKPDLTITDINFSSSVKNENGTLSVTVKNLGENLTSGQGLFNWYNNLSAQNFIFSSETPSILAYRASRPDPTISNPLKKDESITFSWVGKFNTSGNIYLQYTVDNANELDESNESNNTLSKSIVINDSTATSTPNITIANFKYSNNSNLNVPTQIEFDLVNNANSSATFNLSSWDDTTNFPLKSGLYTLAGNQTVHVYLMDVNNISHLANGSNSINVKIVSTDSATVYNSQDFTVIRGGDTSNENISDTPVSINPASSLGDDKIDQLLAQINSLKNIIAEQANQIKYLSSLVKGTNISTDAQNTLNNFITYGSDANTKKLGAGERASVIYSYKNAFDKLPTTQAELSDVIKIANGRWPSATSTDAESQAKIQFKKIYQREANMSNANDNAAVTIMAYGLKQKAENRNLNSEANGIKTFKAIYGHTPNTTEEWNIMQAITYSGSSR